MRFFRRNALGIYAVYGAAIVSGLVVTPIVFHELGTESFGIWSFIGAITIYLMVLDFGVGPSIIRFAAEARGRRSPEDTNALASVGLALYAVIGAITLPAGVALAWLVPELVSTPDDLVWPARISTFLVVLGIALRFPLGLFNNLLLGQQRFDLQNLANFVSTVLYAALVAILIPSGGGLILLGALTLATTLLRLVLPLAWLRSELPGLSLSRLHVTRARIRELMSFSWSNFLVHLANTVVFSTDVVVVGIVLGADAAALYAIPAKLFTLAYGLGSVGSRLLYPALSEYEGSGEIDRQRRLLLTGLRGVTAATLLLALPLLFLPGQLIEAWIGEEIDESAAVMALLALVALVHQPIYLLTQFLIARARQQQIARTLVLAAAANAALSVVLASTVGIWASHWRRSSSTSGYCSTSSRSWPRRLRRRRRSSSPARCFGRFLRLSPSASFCCSGSAVSAISTPVSSCCRSAARGCSPAASRCGGSASTASSGRSSPDSCYARPPPRPSSTSR